MIVLLAKYYAKPGTVETVIEKLREMGELVKEHEPGCTCIKLAAPRRILIFCCCTSSMWIRRP